MHHKYTWRVGVLEVVMILVTLIYVVPLYLLVNVSLRASNDPAPALALPTRITFDNFAEAWSEAISATRSSTAALWPLSAPC